MDQRRQNVVQWSILTLETFNPTRLTLSITELATRETELTSNSLSAQFEFEDFENEGSETKPETRHRQLGKNPSVFFLFLTPPYFFPPCVSERGAIPTPPNDTDTGIDTEIRLLFAPELFANTWDSRQTIRWAKVQVRKRNGANFEYFFFNKTERQEENRKKSSMGRSVYFYFDEKIYNDVFLYWLVCSFLKKNLDRCHFCKFFAKLLLNRDLNFLLRSQ